MLSDSLAIPTIAVKDLEAAKNFYEQKLGLTKQNENPGGVSYKTGSGGIFVYISEYVGTNKATYASWTVEDIGSIISDLKAKGVNFLQYDNMPNTTRDGDIHTMGSFKIAWFQDPDGNIFSIDNGQM